MCKICSDIEQYQRLVDAGIDPSTSDMYIAPSPGFRTEPSDIKVGDYKYDHPRSVPAWSLSRILSFLPECIHIVGEYGTYTYYLDISQDQIGYGKIVTSPQGELVDAAVSILVWLHDNHERVGFMYPDEFKSWRKEHYPYEEENNNEE